MIGKLTGYVLEVHPQSDGGVHLRLSGITPNGNGSGIHWIHTVMFSKSRAGSAALVKPGQIVAVDCMAAYRVFKGRQGNGASRVDIHGLAVTTTNGTLVQRKNLIFLQQAVNHFQFAGYAVNPALHKPEIGVTKLRLAVQGRTATHYFECEGWRDMAALLRTMGRGAELQIGAILRRDHKEISGQSCAFDVMEVIACQRTQLPSRLPARVPQAAD